MAGITFSHGLCRHLRPPATPFSPRTVEGARSIEVCIRCSWTRRAEEGAQAPSLPLPRQGTGIEKGVFPRKNISRGLLSRKIWPDVLPFVCAAPRQGAHPSVEGMQERNRPPPRCRKRRSYRICRQEIERCVHRNSRWNSSRVSHGRSPTRSVALVNKRSRAHRRRSPWSSRSNTSTSLALGGGPVLLQHFSKVWKWLGKK